MRIASHLARGIGIHFIRLHQLCLRFADLANLDDGDVKFQLDFKQVYATVLNKWLGADANLILKQPIKPLDFI